MAGSSSAGSLPSAWHIKDTKLAIVEVTDGVKVQYKAGGTSNIDGDAPAAAVCANHPIPLNCALYYFEIEVLSGGRDGRIAIGFSAGSVSMSRPPGWERNSFGYHADSGKIFRGSTNGSSYARSFKAGDTVGCYYNQIDNIIAYTKDGKDLGPAFTDVKGLILYPTVGLRSPGEKIEANFGARPFVFDFNKLQRDMKMRALSWINAIELPKRDLTLNSLVFSYLVHHGYCESAIALAQEAAAHPGPLEEEVVQQIRQRRRIQDAVVTGNIDEAIELTNSLAPEVFMSNPSVLFALKCQKFIEMVREGKDKETVEFGRSDLGDFEMETEENKATVQDVFSLLAYKDPSRSPLAHLLDPSRRTTVAELLNSAILVSQNKPRRPPLEVLHCQAVVAQEHLATRFGGAASLVDIGADIYGCSQQMGKMGAFVQPPTSLQPSPMVTDNVKLSWPASGTGPRAESVRDSATAVGVGAH